MHSHQELITQFYTAFKHKDFKTMQESYSEDATFSDPVFTNLNTQQVRAIWEMLVKRGTDLELSFSNVESTGDTASAQWIATYTFSASKRKVINKIQAHFIIRNGKIAEHTDSFSFYRWSRQALGPVGFLLGWTPMIKNKVRKTAMKNLGLFIAQKT
jgi:ketosteroid isomerase-like protein